MYAYELYRNFINYPLINLKKKKKPVVITILKYVIIYYYLYYANAFWKYFNLYYAWIYLKYFTDIINIQHTLIKSYLKHFFLSIIISLFDKYFYHVIIIYFYHNFWDNYYYNTHHMYVAKLPILNAAWSSF